MRSPPPTSATTENPGSSETERQRHASVVVNGPHFAGRPFAVTRRNDPLGRAPLVEPEAPRERRRTGRGRGV